MSVECREEGCKRPRDPKNYAIDHTIHPSSRCALALAACHAAASKGKVVAFAALVEDQLPFAYGLGVNG